MKYCSKCGTKLFDEAVFCPNCHENLIEHFKLTVTRIDKIFKGTIYPITIFIRQNNAVVQDFSLSRNESQTVELPEGYYEIKVDYWWSHKTDVKNINLRADTSMICRGYYNFGSSIEFKFDDI